MLNKNLLHVLQITNANFPIGSFAHSFGLETYINKDIINDTETLDKILKSYIYGPFLHVDLLAIVMTYDFLKNESFEKIWEIDRKSFAQGMSKETRQGNKRIALQMLKVYLDIYKDCENLKKYQKAIKENKAQGNPGICYALLCDYLKIDLEAALLTHTHSTISALIQNSIRAIPLGQLDGQRAMFNIKNKYYEDVAKKALKIDASLYFCKNYTEFEMSQMEHEDIAIRLFMS